MEYLSTAQAAQKWGISANRVFKLIQAGRIPSAVKLGSMWMIPTSTEKPVDGRTKAGKAAIAAVSASKAKPEVIDDDDSFRFPSFEHRDPASFDPPLTPEECQVKAAFEAFHACRFDDADTLLAEMTEHFSNRYCRISALYAACMLDIFKGRSDAFLSHYQRLFAETENDFPHNKEMKEYVHLIDATLGNEDYYLNEFRIDPTYHYHESFLTRLAMLSSLPLIYAQNNPTIAELNTHELHCKLLKENRAYADLQTIHLYLGTGYSLLGDLEHAKHHFAAALDLAGRYELYYNVVTHYLYWSPFIDSTLMECTPEVRARILQLCDEMQPHYLRFMEKASLNSIYTLVPKGDYALLYYAVQGYTNKEVAKILHISPGTVGKRYSKICTAFGVSGKKQLIAFYQSFLNGTDLNAPHLTSGKQARGGA